MSDADNKNDARDYSNTLYLPKTDFPMRAGLPKKEPEILSKWMLKMLLKRATAMPRSLALKCSKHQKAVALRRLTAFTEERTAASVAVALAEKIAEALKPKRKRPSQYLLFKHANSIKFVYQILVINFFKTVFYISI